MTEKEKRKEGKTVRERVRVRDRERDRQTEKERETAVRTDPRTFPKDSSLEQFTITFMSCLCLTRYLPKHEGKSRQGDMQANLSLLSQYKNKG